MKIRVAKVNKKTFSEKELLPFKKDILEIGRRIYSRNQVAANDGNISIRLDDRHILITPTGVSKGYMTADDLIVVDKRNGEVVHGSKKPSSEVFMHIKIYDERQDVNGILHSHPVYATGFAVSGLPLDQFVLPEAIISLGTIPLVKYGAPGTEEFYLPLVPLLKDYDAFLLANHGALTVGRDIYKAYYKMETVEHFAHITYIAKTIGKVTELKSGQVDKLIYLREKYGVKKSLGIPKKVIKKNKITKK